MIHSFSPFVVELIEEVEEKKEIHKCVWFPAQTQKGKEVVYRRTTGGFCFGAGKKSACEPLRTRPISCKHRQYIIYIYVSLSSMDTIREGCCTICVVCPVFRMAGGGRKYHRVKLIREHETRLRVGGKRIMKHT